MKASKFIVSFVIATISPWALANNGEVEGKSSAKAVIPVAPISVLKKQQKPKARVQTMNSRDQIRINSASVIVMKEGHNQIVPIAVDHLNRIVTPFVAPSIMSTSLSGGEGDGCGEICIKDNVIYVATDKTFPVTMFITDGQNESNALSLTMVPKEIPPREITLKLAGESASKDFGYMKNEQAKNWEQSQPYIKTIRDSFRAIALNEVPSGYVIKPIVSKSKLPDCKQLGISTNFVGGQVLLGHNINIYVGVASNVTDKIIEFKEQNCGNWNVAAVTTWPHKMLEPNQKTEVYVAVKSNKRVTNAKQRRSLVN